jgi:hypothetical protein
MKIDTKKGENTQKVEICSVAFGLNYASIRQNVLLAYTKVSCFIGGMEARAEL